MIRSGVKAESMHKAATGDCLPTDPAPDVVLQVNHLTVDIATDRGLETVLDDLSFQLRRGEVTAIVGESGSGKSMTCLACMALLPSGATVVQGEIWIDSLELTAASRRTVEDVRGKQIAMIFQEPMTALNPGFRVGKQVSEPYQRHLGLSKKSAWAAGARMLERVGLANADDRMRSYPHEFSGGMRQRVVIAAALACGPDVLVADEPTTALDVTVQAQVLNLLRTTSEDEGMAVLFVTHDLGVVADIAQRVIVMYAGQIVETASVDELFLYPKHPYTAGLLSATPKSGSRGSRLPVIPGRPPALDEMPAGCRFAPRCPYAEDECALGPIPLRLTDQGSVRCRRADDIQLKGVAND